MRLSLSDLLTFVLPPGFVDSILTYKLHLSPSSFAMRSTRTSGVWPTSSRTDDKGG